jgi:hypothetical protein
VLYFGQRLGIHHVSGFLGQRAVQTQDMRLGEKVIKLLHTPNPEGLVIAGRLIGVVKCDVHAEGFCAERHGRADAPQSDDAEHAPPQTIDGRHLGIMPCTNVRPQTRIQEHNPARQ